MVQSQWGPVHLFDLCLRCDHLGMALALAAHSVPGCVLEDHHLGPTKNRNLWGGRSGPCTCRGWSTCPCCCWAFPVEQGIWMEDWDEEFQYAISAAEEAAATPLTRAMLDVCSRDKGLPFSGSPKAMARLLDIAILTGNQKAAVNLSKKCQLRPLRRWGMNHSTAHMWEEDFWKAARTALWAGAGFQDLMVRSLNDWSGTNHNEDLTFSQILFLRSKLEDWQEIRHLLPQCHEVWRPRNCDNWLGEFFLEGPHRPRGGMKLSLDKIRAAEDAGLDLQFSYVEVFCGNDATRAPVTLLDMAIWCGQPDFAEACVDGGIELKGDEKTLAWHKQVLRGEGVRLAFPPPVDYGPNLVPSEAETAAAAAGRAWLKRSWKSESSQKGFVLYQMMLKMFKGRSFPMALVQQILTFATTVPKIIDQLDLWEHVGDWMATICGRPTSVHPAADCNTADVEEPEGMQHNGEAGRLPFIEVFVLFPLLAAKHQDSKWEPFLGTIAKINCIYRKFCLAKSVIHSKQPWHILAYHFIDIYGTAPRTSLRKHEQYHRSHLRINKLKPDRNHEPECRTHFLFNVENKWEQLETSKMATMKWN